MGLWLLRSECWGWHLGMEQWPQEVLGRDVVSAKILVDSIGCSGVCLGLRRVQVGVSG